MTTDNLELAPVAPRRSAIVFAIIIALWGLAALVVGPVPDPWIALVGGDHGIARHGGVRVRFNPADADDPLLHRLRDNASLEVEGKKLVLDFVGLDPRGLNPVVEALERGGLRFQEVLETDYLLEVARLVGLDAEADDDAAANDVVALASERWETDDGPSRNSPMLRGRTREAIQAVLDRARAAGAVLPAASEVVFERVEFDSRPGREAIWRSHVVSSQVTVDGGMVASATPALDPNTNRPIVLLELTALGADRFCALSRRMVGRKLAIIVGDRVRSAPVIRGPICGGRASIAMGGRDPQEAIAERDALMSVLSLGALPRGTVESVEPIAASESAGALWLVRAIAATVAGLMAGALAWLVIVVVRPRRAARGPLPPGPFPWRRLLVTLFAPLALWLGGMIDLPSVDPSVLGPQSTATDHFSMIALGLAPIYAAFVSVELVALAVRPLRWRRHDPRGRIALGQAVAACAIVLAIVQAHFITTMMIRIDVAAGGRANYLAIMATLVGGTLLLALLAGLITEYGLGNGYATLFVASVAVVAGRAVQDLPLATFAFAALGVVPIIIATIAVLRWRIASSPREAGLVVPSCGIAAASQSLGIWLVLSWVASIGFDDLFAAPSHQLLELEASTAATVVVGVIGVVVWSLAFARPAVVERVALQAGATRVGWGSWARATAASGALLGVGAFVHRQTGAANSLTLMSPLVAMVATAAVVDIVNDARARRSSLVPATIIHQPQYLGVVEQVLARAGIPFHCRASAVRTLLAFFGPWAPIVVMVPEANGPAARELLAGVFTAPRGSVPSARATS